MKRMTMLMLAVLCAPLVGLCQVIRVSGTIEVNTTWTSDNTYHVVDTLTVAGGAKLTIEPGTVVKFATRRASDSRYEVNLYIQGALWDQGTAGNKIYFTSVNDAAVGGNAGGSGSPASTDWGRIFFHAGSDSANTLMEHCVIRYGGNRWSGTSRWVEWVLNCQDASPTIRKPSLPDAAQQEVYNRLGIDWRRAFEPVKTEVKG